VDPAQGERVAEQSVGVVDVARYLDHPWRFEYWGGLGRHVSKLKLTDSLDRGWTELLNNHAVPCQQRVHGAVVALVGGRHGLALSRTHLSDETQSIFRYVAWQAALVID
jgi:hypothetical protein